MVVAMLVVMVVSVAVVMLVMMISGHVISRHYAIEHEDYTNDGSNIICHSHEIFSTTSSTGDDNGISVTISAYCGYN